MQFKHARRRQVVYGSLIALLVVLNAGRLVVDSDPVAGQTASPVRTPEISVARLRLSSIDEAASDHGKMQRDLFVVNRPPPMRTVIPTSVPPVVKGPRPPTAAELAERAAQTELEKFKLFGVIINNGLPRAFLNRADENYSVRVGETIDGKYTVEEITTDSVVLNDDKTRLQYAVPLISE